MHKISIITVNYNDATGLKKTLDSVAAQTYRYFEHIIVDGGSTDRSVEIIEAYASVVACDATSSGINDAVEAAGAAVIKWISEKDTGIYDAMNKGIVKATGDYLLFLNGGDVLASDTALADVYSYLTGEDFIIGRAYFSMNGKRYGNSPLLSEKDMSMYYMYLHGINHQSAFIKRTLLLDNPYDTSVKINADWLFFVQLIVLNSASVKFVDLFFADFDCTGISSNTTAVIKEREEILLKALPERVARDYITILPHYYEVIRIQWLLKHPICYKIYRGFTTLCRKLLGE